MPFPKKKPGPKREVYEKGFIARGERIETHKRLNEETSESDNIADLWDFLSIREKQYITAFTKFDTKTECVRRIVGDSIVESTMGQWLPNQRMRNPCFKKAELLREQFKVPDEVLIELAERDMKVIIAADAYKMVTDGKLPEKEMISTMKRLVSKVTPEDTDKESLGPNKVISFMDEASG